MSDYQLRAVLTASDAGFSATVRRAVKQLRDIDKGVAGVKKNTDIKVRLGVDGLAKIERLQNELRKAGMNTRAIEIRLNDNATSRLESLRAKISALTGKSHNILVNIQARGTQAVAALQRSLSNLSSGIASVAGIPVAGLGAMTAGYIGANSVKNYMDFEYQATRNKALFTTGMNAEDADRYGKMLAENARYWGSKTPLTPSEVGKIQEYQALAGWTPEQAMAGTPAIINAALSSGENSAMVSDILTDDATALGYKAGDIIQNAKGEDVEAFGHFVDVMLRTTLKSNTNFQDLGYAMKYVAPLAHTYGASVEEVSTLLAILANSGIKGDSAGTAMRSILTRLAAPNKNSAEAMETLGIEFDRGDGNSMKILNAVTQMRDKFQGGGNVNQMLDFFEQVTGEEIQNKEEISDFLLDAQARGGMGNIDKSKFAKMLSGQYALSGFLALMQTADEDWKRIVQELFYNADGTGDEITAEMMDTLRGDLQTLDAAWQDFSIELMTGEGSSGLRNFVQGLTDDINNFKNAIKDGIDISDVGGLIMNVVNQLKDKFIALDGVGSILAGGALMAGMTKILNTGIKLKRTLSEWSRGFVDPNAKKSKSGTSSKIIDPLSMAAPAVSSVNTMTIRAGVVNLSGTINQTARGNVTGAPATSTARGTVVNGTPATSTITGNGTPASNGIILPPNVKTPNVKPPTSKGIILPPNFKPNKTAAVSPESQIWARIATQQAEVNMMRNNYNNIVQNEKLYKAIEAEQANAARMSTLKSSGATAGVMSGMFAAMDIYQTRQYTAGTLQEAQSNVVYQKQVLKNLQEQVDNGRDPKVLEEQLQVIAEAENNLQQTIEMNRRIEGESEAGALGSVLGSVIGAGLGSIVPGVGTMFGGMIGGMLGGTLGEIAGVKIYDLNQSNRDIINGQGTNNADNNQGTGNADNNQGTAEIKGTMEQITAENPEVATIFGTKTGTPEGEWTFDLQHGFQRKVEEEPKGSSLDIIAAAYSGQKQGTNNPENIQGTMKQITAENPEIETVFGSVENVLEPLANIARTGNVKGTDLTAQSAEYQQEYLEVPKYDPAAQIETPNNLLYDFLDSLVFGKAAAASLDRADQPSSEFQFPEISLPELPEFNISEKIRAEVESANEAWEELTTSAQSAVESLISDFDLSGLETNATSAMNAVETTFSDGLNAVESEWSTITGFFGGIFGGLGGIASATGATIAAGVNSGIGMIQSAWEALSGWLGAKISSLASMAASAASMVGINIGNNFTGTNNFGGGWTEINERGGELIYLPTGTKIYPHATTKRILQQEMHERVQSGEFDNEVEIPHNFTGTNYFRSNVQFLPKGRINTRGRHGWMNTLPAVKAGLNPPKIDATNIVNHFAPTQNPRSNKENIRETLTKRRPAIRNLPSVNGTRINPTAIINHNINAENLREYQRHFDADVLEKIKQSAQPSISNDNLRDNFNLTNETEIKREAFETDALGNILGAESPEYNRITAEDSIMVARAKREAQLEQLRLANPALSLSNLTLPPMQLPKIPDSSTNANTSNTNNSNFNINLGGVNFNNNVDFDDIAHQLATMIRGAAANYSA